jgi:hypothetical protein
MITKLDPASRINKEFSVVDIENRRNGDLIEISTYNGVEETRHANWYQWYKWISKVSKYDKRYQTIYAHNGGGWDFLSFIHYVISTDDKVCFYTIENGGKIVAVMIPNGKVTIKLCDSLYLIKCSLDQAGEKYVGRGKVKDDRLPEELYDTDREKFNQYLSNDCKLLYEVLCKFADIIYTKVAPIPKMGLTLPSTALKCFRTSYLDNEISIPKCIKLKQALRNAYTGGRVEVFKPGEYKNVNVFDFNSLYPYVMATTNVPTGGDAQYTRKSCFDKCGVFHIEFVQHDTNRPALFVQNGIGIYKGCGWFFSNEIRCFLENRLGNIKTLEGYAFPKSEIIFGSYVDRLYSLRMSDKNSPLGETCKLLLNSLYGKFGIKEERKSTLYADHDVAKEWKKAGKDLVLLDEENLIWQVTEIVEPAYEHVGIAGTITSQARAVLYNAMNENTIYCDTDSIHTTDTMATSNKLGELKLEFSGAGVYCGKKLYALKNGKEEKIRAKGIKVGGKFGFSLCFDDLANIANGGTVETEFISGTTANEVYKGKKPCTLTKENNTRKRKIRKTVK